VGQATILTWASMVHRAHHVPLTAVLVLAIDTATPAVTAGVVELTSGQAPVVLGQCVTVDARAHGELLIPHILAALDAAGASLGDLAALACGVGPGPFTGLRAGMVTAAALGHSLDVPVHPVCSLDALAIDTVADTPGHRLLVAIDARRKELYWAGYAESGLRVAGPEVTRPAELAELLAGLGVTRAAGAGARMYADLLGLELLGPDHPTPAGLVSAARAAIEAGHTPQPLAPLYLRRPDAVLPGTRKRVLR
jgi:tRNA threonylcarbamoyl adenosine modification protein YeaZ